MEALLEKPYTLESSIERGGFGSKGRKAPHWWKLDVFWSQCSGGRWCVLLRSLGWISWDSAEKCSFMGQFLQLAGSVSLSPVFVAVYPFPLLLQAVTHSHIYSQNRVFLAPSFLVGSAGIFGWPAGIIFDYTYRRKATRSLTKLLLAGIETLVGRISRPPDWWGNLEITLSLELCKYHNQI